jgi:Asp-tRNA(Asn)/Glu-tRNA(Gln) amidotransferase A subunit family amidase
MGNDLGSIGAAEALQCFADRSLSPVEFVDALHARASEARWANGTALPLDGIPVAVTEEQPIAGESWRLEDELRWWNDPAWRSA